MNLTFQCVMGRIIIVTNEEQAKLNNTIIEPKVKFEHIYDEIQTLYNNYKLSINDLPKQINKPIIKRDAIWFD